MKRLDDVRLLVTREAGRAGAWLEAIVARGATAVHVPLIFTRRIHGTPWAEAVSQLEKLRDHEVVVGLASAKAAEHWVELQQSLDRPVPVRSVVAVGDATAEKARSLGLNVEIADEANAVGLGQALEKIAAPTATLVLPRARNGRPETIDYLKGKGRTVSPIALYETCPVARIECDDPEPVHWVISASPSAARAYTWHKSTLVRLGVVVPRTQHAAIGETTARAAISIGLRTKAISKIPDIEAILDAISDLPKLDLAPPSEEDE